MQGFEAFCWVIRGSFGPSCEAVVQRRLAYVVRRSKRLLEVGQVLVQSGTTFKHEFEALAERRSRRTRSIIAVESGKY